MIIYVELISKSSMTVFHKKHPTLISFRVCYDVQLSSQNIIIFSIHV